MISNTQRQVEKMQALPNNQSIDISKEMMELTLNIVASAMFSSEVNGAIEVVSHEIERISMMATARFNNPFRLPIKYPTPTNLLEKKSVKNLDDVLNPIIRDRRKATEHFDDLLAMLMEAKDEDTGEQMSDQQLRDETMTIFLAGHETTALALSWLWYLLAKNPGEAQKLYDEIDQVTQGKVPTLEMLQRMAFTKMVMDETLRMYPPAWLIGRENIEDDESRGITPVWHDESAWNCYLCERTPRTLTPEYCMVEEQHLREAWQISHFKPKIIALKKDHDALRK